MKTIKEAVEYLRRLGFKEQIDYTPMEDIGIVALNIDRVYFCSVGVWDKNKWEVFELHHGAEVSENGKEWITDGELWQYKVYSSLKRALDFALECKKNNKLPETALRVW